MEIGRGCTPVIKVKLSVDTEYITICHAAFSQRGQVVLMKTLENGVRKNGNIVEIALSEDDTLKFDETADVDFQLRVGFNDGGRAKTQVFRLAVGRILEDGVIGDD